MRFTVWHRRWHRIAVTAVLAVTAGLIGAGCSSAPGSGGMSGGSRASAADSAAGAGARGAAAHVPGPGKAWTAALEAMTSVSGPIVALGDSYTAGALLPLSVNSAPPGCLRSADSYPVKVASALHDASGLVDAACTGAGAGDMTGAQKTGFGTNPPQLDSLAPDDSLVMLTLGGDDLGFMNVLQECMKLSVANPFGSPCEAHYAGGGTDRLAALVSAEGPRIRTVLAAIHARAPRALVVLVGYPDLFPASGGCWPVVPIASGDIGYLGGIESRMNAMLAAEAAATGTLYVNTYMATLGHDFCASSGTRDIEGLVPTSLAAPFHPNARGQAAMAARVIAALQS